MNRAPLALALIFTTLAACALFAMPRKPDPAAALYGAERMSCVEMHDEADAARDCMRRVDERYHRDGGHDGQ